VLACEARLVTQVLTRDAMPPSQVFLGSLRSQRSGLPQYLHTAFVPSYSERFFLQVVDGFRLDDSIANGPGSEQVFLFDNMLSRLPPGAAASRLDP
jgi:hypothetical protein